MFFTVQAPDVAFSQIVVGGIALPAMLFLAMAKIRAGEKARREDEEEEKPQRERP
jgi:energy-converting hydrogenase B subunit D